MPNISRRTILASTAGLAAAGAVSQPAWALTSAAQPSALLAEHRRRAAHVLALEALHEQMNDTTIKSIEATFAEPWTDEITEQMLAIYDGLEKPRLEEREAARLAVAAVDRRIWAISASTYDDIAARAELAEYWNRGWVYTDHHGYDDPYCEKRVADAVLDLPVRPSEPLIFEPPALLLERRRLDRGAYWEGVELEIPLLEAVTPARSWSDIVVRAELSSLHLRHVLDWWADIDRDPNDCRFVPQRSFRELLVGILALGGVPLPPSRRRTEEDGLLPMLDDEGV